MSLLALVIFPWSSTIVLCPPSWWAHHQVRGSPQVPESLTAFPAKCLPVYLTISWLVCCALGLQFRLFKGSSLESPWSQFNWKVLWVILKLARSVNRNHKNVKQLRRLNFTLFSLKKKGYIKRYIFILRPSCFSHCNMSDWEQTIQISFIHLPFVWVF